jgi:hypothetical protein
VATLWEGVVPLASSSCTGDGAKEHEWLPPAEADVWRGVEAIDAVVEEGMEAEGVGEAELEEHLTGVAADEEDEEKEAYTMDGSEEEDMATSSFLSFLSRLLILR